MSNIKELKDTGLNIVEKELVYDYEIVNRNISTGDNDHLYSKLKESIKNAKVIDIIVSLLMDSEVKLILEDLKEVIDRNVKLRISIGSYLNITSPSALYIK